MTNKNRHTTFLLLATGLVSVSRQVEAIEPSDLLIFSKDPVSVRPQLSLNETYNDNIFYQPKAKADFITTITPGLDLQIGKTARNYLALNYRFAQHFYADRSNLNSGEHTLEFRNRFQAQRFSLIGNDQVQFLSSPIGIVDEVRSTPFTSGPGSVGAAPGTVPTPAPTPVPETVSPARGAEVVAAVGERNVERTVQFHSYTAGYNMTEKTSVYLQGLYSETDYEKGIGLYDLNTFRVVPGFAFHIVPKLSLFGEVYYGQTATTPNFAAVKNPHSDFIGGFIGARGKFTEKLTGVVKVGYEERWFSDDSSAPSSPVADLTVDYRFSEKTSVSLNYARVHDISVQFARESYTADNITLQLQQALGTTGKWFASAGGEFGHYDYESLAGSGNRTYDRYSANLNLAYRLQVWLTANLGYSFESINSDSGGLSDYDVNRVALSLAIGY
jgi:hypothetical protein